MAKHETNINIYGGNVQVMPNVREVEQHIHTKDGETVIINKFKPWLHRTEQQIDQEIIATRKCIIDIETW